MIYECDELFIAVPRQALPIALPTQLHLLKTASARPVRASARLRRLKDLRLAASGNAGKRRHIRREIHSARQSTPETGRERLLDRRFRTSLTIRFGESCASVRSRRNGKAVTEISHCYKRHGATTRFAALDV
jgi:hypothetical protein